MSTGMVIGIIAIVVFVVIVFIGIIAAIAVPSFVKARNKAVTTSVVTRIDQFKALTEQQMLEQGESGLWESGSDVFAVVSTGQFDGYTFAYFSNDTDYDGTNEANLCVLLAWPNSTSTGSSVYLVAENGFTYEAEISSASDIVALEALSDSGFAWDGDAAEDPTQRVTGAYFNWWFRE
jgi:type II secretory pathway pseudopilin PulG